MTQRTKWLGVVVGLVLLTACGGAGPGDAVNGAKLFTQELAGEDVPTCISCHAVEPGKQAEVMGNNLSNVGNRAGQTVRGQSAEAYLYASIVDPDVYLAGGFQEGIHYRGYGKVLSRQQLNDLVAYMLTLRSGQDE